MPDRALSRDRLLPCLLDRLTDRYPRATREGREHRSVSLRQYRDAVLRDLTWLLNCSRGLRDDDLQEYSYARSSVLCYGIRSIGGRSMSASNLEMIEDEVRTAILRFEPRIRPETLRVTLGRNDDEAAGMTGGHNTVALEIAGELWAEPMPDRLYIRTELDLETGACTVQRN